MNSCKKSYTKLVFILIFGFLILSFQVHTQTTDRNEIKLQNLKNKITLAESKVAAAELNLSVADSMISDGDLRISEAEEEFAQIVAEQKELEKEYRTNFKALKKLAKSKDAKTAEKAESDLKVLDTKYKTDTKSKESEIKMLTRKATRAKSDVDKGLDKQKAAIAKLKDARKTLELAQENYETFISSLESE